MAAKTTDDFDSLEGMRSAYERSREFCQEAYDRAADDERFVTVPGNQWDTELLNARRNRRAYEFPKLRGQIMQIVNEMRQTRPQGKVRGVEESDRGLAELIQGIARNIESVSNAELAYDIAYEKGVKGGFGVWRICTDYLNEDDFEQDIRIKPVYNPRSVTFDSASMLFDRSDSRFAWVEEFLPKSEYSRLYPDVPLSDDFFETRDTSKWRLNRDQVKVAEYWYKKPMKRLLWALSDGSVVFADELGKDYNGQGDLAPGALKPMLEQNDIQVLREREVASHKVYMRMTNGADWLTDEYEFPSKYIPLVPFWGNIENIDGEDYWSGAVRFGKDQQRLHNMHRTAAIEAVAKSPKAPFIVKKGWIKGVENLWKRANVEDLPYLPVNDSADGMPQRTGQAEIPAALIQMAQMDNDDMKAATGIYDASLGNRSNETSGIAINSRKQQGATATYNYIDNLARSIRFSYQILIDMIPKVYDTQRTVRVLGEDGGEKWKTLYHEVQDPETGVTHVINDIRKGKYDVTVTVGPSYATQRMEAADAFANVAAQIGGAAPQLGPLLAYGTVVNMDLPGFGEVESALRKQLVSQGLLPPKDDEEPPQPQQPNPKDVADTRKAEADANYSEARAQQAQAQAAMTPYQVQKLVAETVAQQLQNLQHGASMLPMQDFGQQYEEPMNDFGGDYPPEQYPQFTG